MSFDDVASRFKQIQQAKEDARAAETVDIEELYAIRARMLGVLIRDAREATGFSLEALAQAINVTPDVIQAWEYGYDVPSLPQVELLAYHLEVPISHFWGTQTFAHQRAQRHIDTEEYNNVRNRMIGLMVKSARESKGIEESDLAEAVGISPEYLAAYEDGSAPVPMTVLVSISSQLGVNLAHFLDDHGRVGAFLEIREAIELFAEMPEDVRDFLSKPSNQVYIRAAMALAGIETDNLRSLAESLIDITM